MTLFGNEGVLDLSDQGLLARLAEQERGIRPGAALPEEMNAEEFILRSAAEAGAEAEAEAEKERLWLLAQQEVLSQWPQARGNLQELILKMAEISSRYGDCCLWQKDPQGMLRHAAMELYGMPQHDLQQVMEAALLAGQQEQARLEKERQRRLSLAPSGVRHGSPAPLSPEQEIIRAIAQARRNGIF